MVFYKVPRVFCKVPRVFYKVPRVLYKIIEFPRQEEEKKGYWRKDE
jgi:hypothetical protein